MISIDQDAMLVYQDGKEVKLQPKMYELLLLLVQKKGRFIHTESLLGSIWDGEDVTEHAVWNVVYKLRGALGRGVIENRSFRGYRIKEEEKVICML